MGSGSGFQLAWRFRYDLYYDRTLPVCLYNADRKLLLCGNGAEIPLRQKTAESSDQYISYYRRRHRTCRRDNEFSIVWNTADVLMGLMALINLPVILILCKPAIQAMNDYTKQKKAGKDPVFKAADIQLKDKTISKPQPHSLYNFSLLFHPFSGITSRTH